MTTFRWSRVRVSGSQAKLTRTRMIFRTPEYMSPEQRRRL